MPRKPAKKRDFSKSSIGWYMLARVRCIHEILSTTVSKYDEKTRSEKLPNAVDMQDRLAADPTVGKKYSANTIRRDMQFMRKVWKLPIKYVRARHGFKYTRHVDQLPLVNANEGDLFGLLVFADCLKQYEGTPQHAQLSATMEKLTASMADEVSVSLGDLASTFSHVQTHRPFFKMAYLQKISKAVTERITLKINYKNAAAKNPKIRTVDPYHCRNVNGVWHLYAFDHMRKDVRDFVLSRIQDEPEYVKERAGVYRTFERPKNFNPNKYIDFGVLTGDQLIDVTIRFSAEIATFIRERNWHDSQRFEEMPNGDIKWSAQLNDTTEFCNWILSWGSRAKVIKPKELRAEICEIGKVIAKNNS